MYFKQLKIFLIKCVLKATLMCTSSIVNFSLFYNSNLITKQKSDFKAWNLCEIWPALRSKLLKKLTLRQVTSQRVPPWRINRGQPGCLDPKIRTGQPFHPVPLNYLISNFSRQRVHTGLFLVWRFRFGDVRDPMVGP